MICWVFLLKKERKKKKSRAWELNGSMGEGQSCPLARAACPLATLHWPGVQCGAPVVPTQPSSVPGSTRQRLCRGKLAFMQIKHGPHCAFRPTTDSSLLALGV